MKQFFYRRRLKKMIDDKAYEALLSTPYPDTADVYKKRHEIINGQYWRLRRLLTRDYKKQLERS